MMGAAIAVLVTVGGSEAPTTQADTFGPRANDVLAIDVRTGQRVIQRTLPRGNVRAEEIEVGEGSAWLIRNPVLVKVDPGDGSFTTLGLSNAGVGIAGTSGLAVGFGKVWTFSGDTLFPVDAALFHAPQPIRIPRASGTRAIETGFGSVWLGTDSGDVLRVDPTTYHVSRIAVGEVAAPLAVGSEAVWVLDGFEGELVRVDPRSDSVVARIPFTSALDRIAIGDGVVWVLDTVAGILTGVRERDDTVSPVISLGPDTSDVAVGFGSVWVAQDGSILRIDPITMQVEERMELGDHPITRLAIDTERGRLWLDLAS
jgi:streptogramin lyase